MRVLLDRDRCVGHGRCYSLAPQVFDADDDGYCVVLAGDDIPSELSELARRGVTNCPEQALSIEQ